MGSGLKALWWTWSERPVQWLESIRTLQDWARLHARPGHHTVARTETVKFLIDLQDGQRTCFLETKKWAVHFDFVQRFLDPCADFDRFNLREYTHEHRRFVLGSLMHYLDGDHWTVELSAGDTLPAERIAWMFEHIAARVRCVSSLQFRPVSPLQIDHATRLAGRVPVISSEVLNGSVVYQPVVLGVAYGYVRMVRGTLEVSAVRPSDIVVCEQVPQQIPPVAGLVTSQLQAPLAHVAVLCRQRHTPDMSLRGAVDMGLFTRLEGQLVKLSVAGQDFALEPAGLEQAQAAWAGMRPKVTCRPASDLGVMGLIDLATLAPWAERAVGAVGAVGAKAAQMAQLTRIEGLTTPGGLAIPFSAYAQHLQAAGLGPDLDAMLADPGFARDATVRAQRLAGLREAIQRHPVQGDLLGQLCGRVNEMAPGQRVIFRSSTNAEDLENFNGAGLYDSVVLPADPSPEQVADVLRQVWASVWLQRAFEEREWYRIDHRAVAMGVLVQPFVEDAVATGVAITGNPFRPGQEAVFINAQWAGVTVTAALGDEMPEQYLVATWTGVCEPELISRSSLAGGAPILTEPELLSLTAQLQRIHQALVAGQAGSANAMDVEFALTRERRFVILQARPYTIVYSQDRAPRERPRAGWPQQSLARLRRLAHRVRQGWPHRPALGA